MRPKPAPSLPTPHPLGPMAERICGEAKVFPRQKRGDDCLRACLAGLLEIPMRVLPDPPASTTDNEVFWSIFMDWLEARGMEMVFHDGDVAPETDEPSTPSLPECCRWIAAVPSLTFHNKKHVVLMENCDLIHDPCRGKQRIRRPRKIFYGITVERLPTQPNTASNPKTASGDEGEHDG
jgi:hypothetical protein